MTASSFIYNAKTCFLADLFCTNVHTYVTRFISNNSTIQKFLTLWHLPSTRGQFDDDSYMRVASLFNTLTSNWRVMLSIERTAETIDRYDLTQVEWCRRWLHRMYIRSIYKSSLLQWRHERCCRRRDTLASFSQYILVIRLDCYIKTGHQDKKSS